MQFQFVGELIYYPAAFLTKVSILSLIARIFKPYRKAVYFTRFIVCLMVFYYIPAFFVKVFRCRPIRKTWEPSVMGSCIGSEGVILIADSIFDIVTDIIIFATPIPIVWHLQTSKKRKLRILSVFAGGVLCVDT